MKIIISLFIISCCINLVWADEFKIDVSKELIEAYSQSLSGLEAPVLQKDPKQLPVEIKQGKTDSTSPSSDDKSIHEQQDNQSQPAKASESPVFYQIPNQKQPATNPLQMQADGGFIQRSMPAADPNLGFYPHQIVNQNPVYDDFIGEIHDELRLMVGEDVYGKMVWTYRDLKRLDNWIYETASHFALFGQQSMSGSHRIVGLSNQLKADLFFLGLIGSDKGQLETLRPGSRYDALSLQTVALTGQTGPIAATGTVIEGRFFGILEYLTILNFVYLILAVMALVYLAKLFNFLVKQQ